MLVLLVRVEAGGFKCLHRGKHKDKLEHIEPTGVVGIVKENENRIKRRNKGANGAGDNHFFKPVVLYAAHPGDSSGHAEKRQPARHGSPLCSLTAEHILLCGHIRREEEACDYGGDALFAVIETKLSPPTRGLPIIAITEGRTATMATPSPSTDSIPTKMNLRNFCLIFLSVILMKK